MIRLRNHHLRHAKLAKRKLLEPTRRSVKKQDLNLHTKLNFVDIHIELKVKGMSHAEKGASSRNTAHKNFSGECKSGLVNLKNKPGQ